VVRRCVLSRNFVNEETMAHWGLLCKIKKTDTTGSYINNKIVIENVMTQIKISITFNSSSSKEIIFNIHT